MGTLPRKESLAARLDAIGAFWSPDVVAALNGQEVRLARLKGEFVWYRHAAEDELFLVLEGRLRLLFRDGEVVLEQGELCVVPRGVEHKPVAESECRVLLFEPASTVPRGDAGPAQ
ncbi:MAG TPA: cupin domain-containing protein [Gaiellaceae bacterium]|nr:cupin domain-containing protein [Gaiellaceae bacterium]